MDTKRFFESLASLRGILAWLSLAFVNVLGTAGADPQMGDNECRANDMYASAPEIPADEQDIAEPGIQPIEINVSDGIVVDGDQVQVA